MSDKFNEDDTKKYIEALNFIALETKFGEGAVTIEYAIKIRNHFAFLQSIAGKIEKNILEYKGVTKVAKDEEIPKEKSKKKTSEKK